MDGVAFIITTIFVSSICVILYLLSTSKFIFNKDFLQIVELTGNERDIVDRLFGKGFHVSIPYVKVNSDDHYIYAFRDKFLNKYVTLHFDEGDEEVTNEYKRILERGGVVSYICEDGGFNVIGFKYLGEAKHFYDWYITKNYRCKKQKKVKVKENVVVYSKSEIC